MAEYSIKVGDCSLYACSMKHCLHQQLKLSGNLLQSSKIPTGLPLPATVGVKSCRNHCSSCTTSIAGSPPICAFKKSGTCMHETACISR